MERTFVAKLIWRRFSKFNLVREIINIKNLVNLLFQMFLARTPNGTRRAKSKTITHLCFFDDFRVPLGSRSDRPGP